MSEPKLISPLLDGYAMGGPMSSHDGVVCCPAVKENSDNKYIVKVISVPASQVQLDALLLTGAYKDPAAAMDYFKELSDGVVKEAEVLQKLSKLEGFLPYESWQIVPMEDNHLGYDIYLISSYKRSLEKFMRRNPMTHLGAVNLGLDMCAALAICRNAGYMYVDLKPTNVFISEDKEYRIGDLGFVPMASLKYTSLPSKYRSVYSAPELHDDMVTLNTTADIYSAGLILYQVYNNGVLPFIDKAPAEPLPTPLNADYEIAEIIMKAIAPDPADRWQNPLEMGQALVAYMQRNVINDLPINPPMASVSEPVPDPQPETVEDAQTTPEEPAEAAEALSEELPEELAFMNTITSDETAPGEEDAADLAEQQMTDEVSSMLAQAEELIAHDAPEPAVAPEAPVSETEDPPAVESESEEPAPAGDDKRRTMVIHTPSASKKPRLAIFDDDDEEDDEDVDEDEDEDDLPDPEPKPKKKKTGLIIMLVLLLLLAAVGVGGYYFYKNYYILEIDSIDVTGEENSMTVSIVTDVDTSLLTVVCSDSYGNTKRSTITDGKAVFTDLTPDTMYQIQLVADGFHQLVGCDYSSFTTAAETKILNFTGITGTDDGSVVLSFTVEGPETEWNVICSTEGEEDRTISFSGHTVTVTGLTVGSTYTFTLEPTTKLYMVGENSLQFTASRIVLAQNLQITSCAGGKLTAQWEAPADAAVESWSVMCYGDDGYLSSTTTADTTVTFDGIGSASYTVEVTALGMTQVVRTSITANSITIGDVNVDASDPESLTVTWDYEGNAPEGGWLLMYTIDGSDAQEVVRSDGNSAVISPRIPGATYELTFRTADAATVFNGTHSYSTSNAEVYFNATQKLNFEFVTANLLVTPEKAGWSYRDVSKNDYTTSFTSGQSISVILRASPELRYYVNHEDINILFVIRDGNGNVLPQLINQETHDWYDMWWNSNNEYHYCELDLPDVPTEAGNYTLYMYMNGYAVCTVGFTVS